MIPQRQPGDLHTDETKHRVLRLRSTGMPASKIGGELGMTKGQVVGILDRAKVRGPTPSGGAAEVERARRRAVRPVAVPPVSAAAVPIAAPAAPAPSKPVPVVTAAPLGQARRCQYPLWTDDPGPRPKFCDAQASGFSSYCRHHHSICYVRVRDRGTNAGW